MRDRWFFYQDAAGLWKWAQLDVLGSVLAYSGASFESRDACVEHARSSGYTARRAALAFARASPPANRGKPTVSLRNLLSFR
jgi:hypothetical protein